VQFIVNERNIDFLWEFIFVALTNKAKSAKS